jgi:hypothetical protein
MASLHIRTCKSHDDCKNTVADVARGTRVEAGQNIYYAHVYGPRIPIEEDIKLGVAAWYSEIDAMDESVIRSVFLREGFKTGHAITMLLGRLTRVGCAMGYYETRDAIGLKKDSVITCNYDESAILAQPLYDIGDTCSQCQDSCLIGDDIDGLCPADVNSFPDNYMLVYP